MNKYIVFKKILSTNSYQNLLLCSSKTEAISFIDSMNLIRDNFPVISKSFVDLKELIELDNQFRKIFNEFAVQAKNSILISSQNRYDKILTLESQLINNWMIYNGEKYSSVKIRIKNIYDEYNTNIHELIKSELSKNKIKIKSESQCIEYFIKHFLYFFAGNHYYQVQDFELQFSEILENKISFD